MSMLSNLRRRTPLPGLVAPIPTDYADVKTAKFAIFVQMQKKFISFKYNQLFYLSKSPQAQLTCDYVSMEVFSYSVKIKCNCIGTCT